MKPIIPQLLTETVPFKNDFLYVFSHLDRDNEIFINKYKKNSLLKFTSTIMKVN